MLLSGYWDEDYDSYCFNNECYDTIEAEEAMRDDDEEKSPHTNTWDCDSETFPSSDRNENVIFLKKIKERAVITVIFGLSYFYLYPRLV